MEQLILNGLIAYSKEGCYPWHMPGHKRQLNTIFPEQVSNPFHIDVTEVGELDELHAPEGMILESMKRTAEIYGSHKSFYLVNGSTCGILAAISSVCRAGDSILIARNSHKSVYHAISLLGLKPIYVMPEWNEELSMFGGVNPATVKSLLNHHTDIKAVVIVSPTYEGVVSDIEKLSKLAHKKHIPLIVDAAHGAHFEYMANANETISNTNYKSIPNPAIRLGADLVIESLHKTLPAMTQCAILHEKSAYVDSHRLEEYLSIYQSSSPSYVFLASIEACIEKMHYERDGRFIMYKALLAEYREKFAGLRHIRLVKDSDFRKLSAVGYDDGKLVFSAINCGIETEAGFVPLTGVKLGEILRHEYGQMVELAAGNYVIAMTSIADSKEAFESLFQAMEAIDNQLIDLGRNADTIVYNKLPEQKLLIDQARDRHRKDIALADAVKKISGEYIYMFPPGIPLITPGEIFTKELIEMIQQAKALGLNVKGVKDDKVSVVSDRLEFRIKKHRFS